MINNKRLKTTQSNIMSDHQNPRAISAKPNNA